MRRTISIATFNLFFVLMHNRFSFLWLLLYLIIIILLLLLLQLLLLSLMVAVAATVLAGVLSPLLFSSVVVALIKNQYHLLY